MSTNVKTRCLLPALIILIFAGMCLFHFCTIAHAESLPSAKPLRPFYLIGHNADTVAEVEEYLKMGASGFDIDVNVAKSNTNHLCIGHGPDLGTGGSDTNAPPIVNYFREVHRLARQYTNLSLIYLDCKALVATPEKGRVLLQVVRNHLVGLGPDRIPINVIITGGTVKDRSLFEAIAPDLRDHEAVMFDYEDHPGATSEYFSEIGVINQCYADGTGVMNFAQCLFARHIRPGITAACALRDQKHQIRLVLTWTVNSRRQMEKYIKLGVDGMISEKSGHFYNPGGGFKKLAALVRDRGPELGIRPATRADDPLYPVGVPRSAAER